MAEQITPAAFAVLVELRRLGHNDSSPVVDWTVSTELASRGLAADSGRGLRITEEGRTYLLYRHNIA